MVCSQHELCFTVFKTQPERNQVLQPPSAGRTPHPDRRKTSAFFLLRGRPKALVTLSSSLRAMISSLIPNKSWARGGEGRGGAGGGGGEDSQTFSNGAQKSHSHQREESPHRLRVALPTLPCPLELIFAFALSVHTQYANQ